MDPPSGCRAPRIRSSKVDLPAPLRPTSPALAPSAICALAWSSKTRPPIRYVRPEMVSILLCYHIRLPTGDEPFGDGPNRHLRLDLWRLAREILSIRFAPF